MNEINLPIKYALSPINTSNDNVIAYIIVKCYFLEGSITCNIDGTMDAKCKVVECKDAQNAFKNGQIDPEYVREVSCVFNDIDLAKAEQMKINESIIERLVKDNNVDFDKLKEKQQATVRSIEKLRSIKDKRFIVSQGQEKRLIYSKE